MTNLAFNKETIENLTLENVIELYKKGMCCVFADGKLKFLVKERKDDTNNG